MKGTTKAERMMEAAAGLDRLKNLEYQLAAAPARSRHARRLSMAIRTEAAAYRKSLDVEQATATHDPSPLAGVDLKSLTRASVHRRGSAVPDNKSAGARGPRR
jgi:hypothetical protein